MQQITEKAYAKINLTLDICGTDERGYHYLNSVMQTVSLHDKISILKLKNQTNTIKLICYDRNFPINETNIVYKAAELFFSYTKIYNPGICIRISKRIPKSSGLGGGSADAAATLRALNQLFLAKLTERDLIDLAYKLGSDVPFCVKGGTQLVTGFGEELADIECDIANYEYYFVLIKASRKPSTKEMYRRIDNYEAEERIINQNFIDNIKSNKIDKCIKQLNNDFLIAWQNSVIVKVLEQLKIMGAIATNLTGSGPTVYGVFDNKEQANSCVMAMKENYFDVYCCQAVEKLNIE